MKKNKLNCLKVWALTKADAIRQNHTKQTQRNLTDCTFKKDR